MGVRNCNFIIIPVAIRPQNIMNTNLDDLDFDQDNTEGFLVIVYKFVTSFGSPVSKRL